MKQIYLSLLFFCFTAATAFAQFSATITVTDLGSGLPLENATVQLDGNFVSTDAAGEAVFVGLADDTYEYTVTATCYNAASDMITIAGADADGSIALEAATTNNVFLFIGSPLVITGATVTLSDGANYFTSIVTSDPFGDMVADVPYGEISYTITLPCYEPISGTIMVDCNGDGIAIFAEPVEATSNNVFLFIGSPLVITGATVTLSDGANYFTSIVTSDPFGDMVADVPYGEISYTITLPCYEPISGTIMVDCNNGDGIAIFAEPVEATTNNVFLFIGSPLVITGATVTLSDGANYFTSIVTSDPFGDMVADVPYGEISYTITLPCYEPISGTITVDCNNGDGIALFAEPVEATTNNVFLFIGSPLVITGATVTLSDGANYFTSIVTSDPFGDMVADVPYGEISYTITLPCYEPISGTIMVDCNNGDGIALFAEPVEIVIDPSVTLDGGVLTATATGLDYQWIDCTNGNAPIAGATAQIFAPTESGTYAVIITSGNCSLSSACTNVTITGVEDLEGRDAFAVYPNPFSDVLTVRTSGLVGPVRVELFSLSGQVHLDETGSGLELITVPTAHLAPGSYIVRLSADNFRSAMRVVK